MRQRFLPGPPEADDRKLPLANLPITGLSSMALEE
jgi:hypothetical protein